MVTRASDRIPRTAAFGWKSANLMHRHGIPEPPGQLLRLFLRDALAQVPVETHRLAGPRLSGFVVDPDRSCGAVQQPA